MAEFNLVDDSMKSIKFAEEYIKVGMDMCNEVALDFNENKDGNCEGYIDGVRKMMSDLARTENHVQFLKEAVERVKQAELAEGETMAGMLKQMLSEHTVSAEELEQHAGLRDFDKRLAAAQNPDGTGPSSVPVVAGDSDVEVELTQETTNMRCPYTGQEMVNPVRNVHCGHNYDRDGILQYIKQKKNKAKCPLGGCCNNHPIVTGDLVENKDLKRLIEKKNKQAKKSRT